MPNNATQNLSQVARVDEASIQPMPGARKVYIEGSRPEIRVPFRDISLDDTPTDFDGEQNEPVRVYDTSGPYTDPDVSVDVRKGLLPFGRSGPKTAVIPGCWRV